MRKQRLKNYLVYRVVPMAQGLKPPISDSMGTYKIAGKVKSLQFLFIFVNTCKILQRY